ncbi:unnamed protein product [Protopolystoma xenopodis]|uniref:Uncharacterized protein n=1 Tax=Protopolystoma xenopodis TaxID=117903 RepID=A0A448WUQ6_9PLAT|nr:unnamed protein product [Protopolystoma xenopodis]
MPMEELTRLLSDSELPGQRVQRFVNRADYDRDGRVTLNLDIHI